MNYSKSKCQLVYGHAFNLSFQIKKLLVEDGSDTKDISVGTRFLAGSSAGIIAQTSIYPMEVGGSTVCFCIKVSSDVDVSIDLS